MPKQVKMLQLVGYQRRSYRAGIKESLNIGIQVFGLLGFIWIGSLALEWAAR